MAVNFPSNPTNNQEVTVNGIVYVYNANQQLWRATSAGRQLISLTDTPESYENSAGKVIQVNDAETGVDFVTAEQALGIADIPEIIQEFFVVTDDSTRKQYNLGESITISGGPGITTSSNSAGSIIIESLAETQFVKTYYHEGELSPSAGDVSLYVHAPGTLQTIKAFLGSASGADVVVDVKRNGTSLQQVTITAGAVTQDVDDLAISLNENDEITVDILEASSGSDLYVTLIYTA